MCICCCVTSISYRGNYEPHILNFSLLARLSERGIDVRAVGLLKNVSTFFSRKTDSKVLASEPKLRKDNDMKMSLKVVRSDCGN